MSNGITVVQYQWRRSIYRRCFVMSQSSRKDIIGRKLQHEILSSRRHTKEKKEKLFFFKLIHPDIAIIWHKSNWWTMWKGNVTKKIHCKFLSLSSCCISLSLDQQLFPQNLITTNNSIKLSFMKLERMWREKKNLLPQTLLIPVEQLAMPHSNSSMTWSNTLL